MSVITAENLNYLLDDAIQAYVKGIGTAGTGYGLGQPEGAFGSGLYLGNAYTRIGADANPDPAVDFGRALRTFRDAIDPETLFGEKGRSFVSALDRHLRRFGGADYSSLETYLRYLNSGAGSGNWAALQDYRWRTLYNAIKGGSVYPGRYNLYYEQLNATVTNSLRKLIVGTGQTAGTDISSNYAGGIPCLLVSSFAGASDTVTVTGTFYDPATETATAGQTATFTVTGNGRFYRVAGTAPTDALIVAVSGIVAGASITASTSIIVEAERPALRSGTLGATASTNTTCCLDASASSVNDFYNGLTIKTNADLYTERTISDYDGNTKIATVSVAWATNPTASVSLYRILRQQIS